jgi:hypothetical protein
VVRAERRVEGSGGDWRMWEEGDKGRVNTQLLSWEGVAAGKVGEMETIGDSVCSFRYLCLPKDVKRLH